MAGSANPDFERLWKRRVSFSLCVIWTVVCFLYLFLPQEQELESGKWGRRYRIFFDEFYGESIHLEPHTAYTIKGNGEDECYASVLCCMGRVWTYSRACGDVCADNVCAIWSAQLVGSCSSTFCGLCLEGIWRVGVWLFSLFFVSFSHKPPLFPAHFPTHRLATHPLLHSLTHFHFLTLALTHPLTHCLTHARTLTHARSPVDASFSSLLLSSSLLVASSFYLLSSLVSSSSSSLSLSLSLLFSLLSFLFSILYSLFSILSLSLPLSLLFPPLPLSHLSFPLIGEMQSGQTPRL